MIRTLEFLQTLLLTTFLFFSAGHSQIPVGLLDAEHIGPSVFGGRITDLDVNPMDPTEFYVAYATGGLWHTSNNGATFTPLFDNIPHKSIGDIAVDWTNNILWVGTGENNSSRSSYAGRGVFRSEDGGQSWQHMGLENTHHIGRIILHPKDPNTVWVGAMGSLYTHSADRGVYRTQNGGKSWTKTLYINDSTGCIDLVLHPDNPEVLYAAVWERTRKAWHFQGNGPSSGIYKSVDGGSTWSRINSGANGFPQNDGLGRIGLDICVVNGKTYLYAVLDNQNPKVGQEKEKSKKLTKQSFLHMTKEAFLLLDSASLASFLEDKSFPKKYNVSTLKQLVNKDKHRPSDIHAFLHDANADLFETEVLGAEVYLSTDEGENWTKTHDQPLDKVYYTYGYYFGQIRVAEKDPNQIYIMGVPMLRSEDGGKKWKYLLHDNVHVDHHALWINPQDPKHLILGNDGGLHISYDHGENWIVCNKLPVGQFYTVQHDYHKPYRVYGGLQDNGVWMGPADYHYSNKWEAEGRYPYRRILGGDGMQVQTDSRNPDITYTGYQFGYYARLNTQTDKIKWIRPQHDLGETPLRFNWQTPIWLSRHQEDILYLASNKLHRSLDQGDSWEVISPDLTHGAKVGNVAFGTITAVHESPLKFGLLYTGSDDGRIHVSHDMGASWKDISSGMPDHLWVSRIQASGHNISTVYCALNAYRNDDDKPYLYVSVDFGSTWKKLGSEHLRGAINVIHEDPSNAQILYVGTDLGLYISTDRGQTFTALLDEVKHCPVHDLVVHPTENDLLVATHGRSLIKIDLNTLYSFVQQSESKDFILFPSEPLSFNSFWGEPDVKNEIIEPSLTLKIWSKNVLNNVIITILDFKTKEPFLQKKVSLDSGVSSLNIPLISKNQHYPLKNNEYEIRIEHNSSLLAKQNLSIK